MNVQCLRMFCYAVPHNNRHTLFLENNRFYFVLQQVFELVIFLSFCFTSFCAFFHTFIFECDCTPLQWFYKGCIQSNQQLVLSRLMHSMPCGSAVSLYQALERRPTQGTVIGCAGRITKVRRHLTLIPHNIINVHGPTDVKLPSHVNILLINLYNNETKINIELQIDIEHSPCVSNRTCVNTDILKNVI
jgi:hypothetical protein